MLFRNKLQIVFILLSVLVLASCATGPKLSELSAASTPELAENPEKSRLYVYRQQIFGAAIQPKILVNGEDTGRCKPEGVYIVNLDEGSHTLTSSTENNVSLTVALEKGEVGYVKCYIGWGVFIGRVRLELVNKSQAESDIRDLVYTGSYDF